VISTSRETATASAWTARNETATGVVHGSADSGAVKDLGKPGAGEPHAPFYERGLETEHGLGTAAPAPSCLDSAGPSGHRASPRLYPGAVWRCGRCRGHLSGPQGKHRPRIILR